MQPFPKQVILKQILEKLNNERELLYRAARAAHFEATDEQSKAENKYDTRGLEASYLARGQAKKVKEVEQAIEEFQSLDVRDIEEPGVVQLGTLVQLTNSIGDGWYFLGPRAGGMEVEHDGYEILVITPQSPLGKQLMGLRRGNRLKLETGGLQEDFELAQVW